MAKQIFQCNPKANYLAHKAKIDSAIDRVLGSGRYILGEEVRAFENEFAKYIGVQYGCGVASGTDAIELALRACGIGKGDHVVTVSHTAVATVAAIERAGASPLFVDIDLETYAMSADSLKKLLGRSKEYNIKAIIPVHLYGYPLHLCAILNLAEENDLFVIEDCAQAHGASFKGKKVGACGDCGAFSFYPTKNLGALGDGGMVVTNNEELAQKMKEIREYGWKERYVSSQAGINSRLDDLQAAVLRVKLKHLDSDNEKRKKTAQAYSEKLKELGFKIPSVPEEGEHVFHQFVIRSPQRDKIKTKLESAGIQTAIHYPVPVHLQPAYRDRIPQVVPLEHTEAVCREILSLPIYPELSEQDVDYIKDSF